MKRLSLRALHSIILILFLSTAAYAQFTKAGGGFVFSPGTRYHDEPSGYMGINLKGIVELNLPFHLSPGFGYIFPHVEKYTIFETTTRRTSNGRFLFDLNGHYVFNVLEQIEFYGLAGLNFSMYRYVRKDKLGDEVIKNSHTNIYPGLNLGAGTYIRVSDQVDLMAEGKIVLARILQFNLSAGVLVNLQWFARHDE